MVRRNLAITLMLVSLSPGIGSAQERKLESLIVAYSSFTGNLGAPLDRQGTRTL
jgi:hypothetical protein